MKILYVVPRFPTPSETFVAEEILGIRALGHSVTVVSFSRPSAGQIEQMGRRLTLAAMGVRYLSRAPLCATALQIFTSAKVLALNAQFGRESTYKTNPIVRLLRAAAVADVSRSVGAEVIYGHWPRATEVAVLAAEIARLPVGVSIHAHEVAHDRGHFQTVFDHVSFAAFCNAAAMQYLLDRLASSARAKSHLIYHGVDLSHFPPAPLPLLTSGLEIITAGRLTPTKGIDRLIRAVKVARDRGLRINLTVIGDGGQRAQLEALTVSLGLEARVRFVGWIPYEDMRAHLSRGHLFALMADDSFHDGLPNVVLEAMAVGRPVVISPLPAAHEAVTHRKNGYVLSSINAVEEFVDCCTHLSKDPSILAQWSVAATDTARQHYNRDFHIEQLSALFENVAKSRHVLFAHSPAAST